MKFKYIAALSMLWATSAQATNVFINEIHYDNAGGDVNEFFEVAAPIGTDLTAWSVVLYNGSNSATYNTVDLSTGTSTEDSTTMFVTVTLPANGLQNGAPDGLALVDDLGAVVQFLSYEGTMTAADGPAIGLTSEDLGVNETSSTPIGESLQLGGTGTVYSDFQWQAPQVNTSGEVNTGQVFDGPFVPGSVFINELHYDNEGGDVGEFFEVAAPVGTDLSAWSVVFYNGSNGSSYRTSQLSDGTSTQDSVTMFVTVTLPSNGMQNGSPDGLALIDNLGAVSQFISYEGALTATDGPANGMSSEDIGVSESGTTSIGESLQLTGTGSLYSDFEWQAPQSNTAGKVNTGQDFGGGTSDEAPTIISSSPSAGDTDVAADANISLTFSEDVSLGATNSVSCTTESSIPLTINGSGNSYSLNPDLDFPAGDTCSFTVSASDVTDLDGTPDNMAEDFTISFSIAGMDGNPIPGSVFINEFHYDNDGGDVGEFFEIAAPLGSNLAAWSVVLYNGNNGAPYNTVALSTGTQTQDAVTMFVTVNLPANGLQNGSPDGLALVDSLGAVAQFISYEGTMTATDGPAIGMTSEDIGVSESSSPIGESLQLAGTGAVYSDFVWQSPQSNTAGLVNIGQSFVPSTGAPIVLDFTPIDGATEVALDSTLSISFNENVIVTQWPNLSCTVSGEVTVTGDLSGSTFILTPGAILSVNETCTFTLLANSVIDTDETPNPLDADFVSSFSTTTPFVCDAPETYTLISSIQGNTDESNFQGQTVTVQAIVSAIKPNSSSFFIQEENADFDADPSTSEGIFVFNSNPEYTPAVGEVVTLRGTASEFFSLTQITISSAPLVCGEAVASVTVFSLPFSATDDLETLESMLVTSAAPLMVTDTFELGRFSEVQLSNGRLFNPNNITIPGSAENLALITSNSLNQIKIDDGSDEQNPLVVPFPTGGLSASNPLRLGDTVSTLVGIMDYRFSEFLIVPTVEPTFVMSNPRTSEPELGLGNLKVASLNVLNYFNTLDSGPDICGSNGSQDCRGAEDNGTDGNGLNEFDRQKVKTIAAITAMDADIIGLMEIENDGFGADSSIVDLVDGINELVGENTYSIVESTGPIGTDAITVALIYKSASVSLVGGPLILNSSNSIVDEDGPLFDDGRNRPSLIQKFALVENGEEIVISVNHLKSKGSSCGTGDDDVTTGQGNCNLTRTRAAQALVAFLAEQFGDAPTLIIGDLNAYALEDPITAITTDAGYTDLANLFGGTDAYSYSFSGELGYLDHALASSSLLAKVVDATEWHINADEPIVLDYNLNFKQVEQFDTYFAPDAYRMSDHDPVIVSMQFESNAIVGDVNGNGELDRADFFIIVKARGAVEGDDDFIKAADLDGDGVITRADSNAWRLLFRSAR